MPYTIIQPPLTLKFREMSKSELNDYFGWFLEVLPQRIKELASAVEESEPFENWHPDLAPTSLMSLGDWFVTQIQLRQRTGEEVQHIMSRVPYPIEIRNQELTDRTVSLAVDIGMYFGQVLIRNHPSLRWTQPLNDKRFADFGHAVLVNFGAVPLNPVRTAVTFAYGIADGRQTGNRLRELYDYWSSRVR